MIAIREAKKSDLNKIKENEIKFLQELSKDEKLLKMDDIGIGSSKKSMDKVFKSKNWKFFVAEENRHIIGQIFGKIEKRQKIFSVNKMGYIEVLYIQPPYRKKGVGKKLSSRLEKWFKSKGLSYAELDARKQIEGFWHKFDYKDLYKRMRKKL